MLPGPPRTRFQLLSSYWSPGNLASMWYIPFLLQTPSPVNIPITQQLDHGLCSAGGEGEGFYYHCLEVLAKHMLLASFLNPKDMETSITWCLASSILLAQYYP